MKGKFKFKGNVDGVSQQVLFQNAAQTTLGNDERSISIAVTPSFPKEVDVLDAVAVEEFLRTTMQPLVDAGFKVETQYGPFGQF